MIESVSDFTFVDVDPFKGFLDEFESYPVRANAASGMPYNSLSDLEGKLDPPLKCLDPAWLTELVREIEWFRRSGFSPGSGNPPPAKSLAGARQPPVVLKDFLEEARRTVRGWAEEWESGSCPTGVVVEGGFPTKWTSLGSITMSWEESDDMYEIPPGAGDYGPLIGELDPVSAYRRALAEMAVRDFLSIRLFDREMPDDDPSVPEFGWRETDDQFEEGDDQGGVGVKYLSRRLLALHSDCEKATLMLMPLTGPVTVDPPYLDRHIRTREQYEKNGWGKSHGDCDDGCGTVVMGDGSVSEDYNETDDPIPVVSPDFGWCPPKRIPVSLSEPSKFPVRYSYKTEKDTIAYPIDFCHDKDCEFVTYSVREFWGYRVDTEMEKEWDVHSPTLSWSCGVPDFVEVEEAWVVMVALSRKLDSEGLTETRLTDPSNKTTTPVYSSKGTYDAQLFFAFVPADYSAGTLTVSSIPDVPRPSGGVRVGPPDRPPGNQAYGSVNERLRLHSTLDTAEILMNLGAVVKVKFKAGVKGG